MLISDIPVVSSEGIEIGRAMIDEETNEITIEMVPEMSGMLVSIFTQEWSDTIILATNATPAYVASMEPKEEPSAVPE